MRARCAVLLRKVSCEQPSFCPGECQATFEAYRGVPGQAISMRVRMTAWLAESERAAVSRHPLRHAWEGFIVRW